MTPETRPYKPGEPAAPPGERLQLDPYSGPRSHHASRAFADMLVARERRRQKKKKIALLLTGLVLGGVLAWVAFRVTAAILGLV